MYSALLALFFPKSPFDPGLTLSQDDQLLISILRAARELYFIKKRIERGN